MKESRSERERERKTEREREREREQFLALKCAREPSAWTLTLHRPGVIRERHRPEKPDAVNRLKVPHRSVSKLALQAPSVHKARKGVAFFSVREAVTMTVTVTVTVIAGDQRPGLLHLLQAARLHERPPCSYIVRENFGKLLDDVPC